MTRKVLPPLFLTGKGGILIIHNIIDLSLEIAGPSSEDDGIGFSEAAKVLRELLSGGSAPGSLSVICIEN